MACIKVEDATKHEMKLSAISPLTSIAYSVKNPNLLAGTSSGGGEGAEFCFTQ
jgi:hypothetical protein